jgi:PPM family protein phosphatase
MSLSLRYAARSHVGLIRDGNEDSGYAGPRLLVVADGMGGQAAGELASSVVVRTMAQLDGPGGPLPGDPIQALADRIHEAHERLHTIITDNPQLEGMGTTLTAFLFGEDRIAFAHIGDSRAYRLRAGRLEQLTADHTWVQRLVDEGRISEEEAGHHPQRSLLMRALDGRGQVADADLSLTDAQPGDRLMLCSDGLSSFVSFDTLEQTLAGYADPHQAAEALIQLALRAGGPDNVTCIVGDLLDSSFHGQGASPHADTQYIEMPVVVGAAAEQRGGLPTFGSPQSQTAVLPKVSSGQEAAPAGDEIPGDHPAGRAARLRRSDRRENGSAQNPGEPVGEEEAEERKRSRWVKPTIVTGVCVAVLGALVGGAYYWTQQQYYVADDNGQVAIYQGVHTSVAGFKLSHVYSTSPKVEVSTLPTANQTRVHDSITATSLSDAQSIVHTLSVLGASCAALSATPSSSPTVPGIGATGSPQTGSGAPALGKSATPSAPAGGKGAANGPTANPTPSPSVSPSAVTANQFAAGCPGVGPS